jgi:hypothetical protein
LTVGAAAKARRPHFAVTVKTNLLDDGVVDTFGSVDDNATGVGPFNRCVSDQASIFGTPRPGDEEVRAMPRCLADPSHAALLHASCFFACLSKFLPNQYKGIDDTIVQWLCIGALRR